MVDGNNFELTTDGIDSCSGVRHALSNKNNTSTQTTIPYMYIPDHLAVHTYTNTRVSTSAHTQLPQFSKHTHTTTIVVQIHTHTHHYHTLQIHKEPVVLPLQGNTWCWVTETTITPNTYCKQFLCGLPGRLSLCTHCIISSNHKGRLFTWSCFQSTSSYYFITTLPGPLFYSHAMVTA